MIETSFLVNIELNIIAGVLFLVLGKVFYNWFVNYFKGTVFYWLKLKVSYIIWEVDREIDGEDDREVYGEVDGEVNEEVNEEIYWEGDGIN